MSLQGLKSENTVAFFAATTIIWFVAPFLSLFVMLYFIGKYRLSDRQITYITFLISCTFGLLAYTQQSLSNTDVSRYYAMFEPFVDIELNLANYFLLTDSLAYTFTIGSVFLTSLFENVQVVSGFWVYVAYQFYFLGLKNYLQIRRIRLSPKQMCFIVSISIFGLILFTQVSELLKQGAAISLFFYAFTYYLKTGNRLKTGFLLFLVVGVHFSEVVFILLFFFIRLKRKLLLALVPLSLVFFFVDITALVAHILPSSGWLGAIQSKADVYVDEGSSFFTIRYLSMAFVLFMSALYLDKCTLSGRESLPVKIAYSYCIILSMIGSDGVSFLRFTILSYWLSAIIFVELLRVRTFHVQTKQLVICTLGLFYGYSFLMMTYDRTLRQGAYLSSYLENDPIKILTFSVPQYLGFDALQQD